MSLRDQERVFVGLISFIVFVLVAYLFGLLVFTWRRYRSLPKLKGQPKLGCACWVCE